jgi:hypothetical protein
MQRSAVCCCSSSRQAPARWQPPGRCWQIQNICYTRRDHLDMATHQLRTSTTGKAERIDNRVQRMQGYPRQLTSSNPAADNRQERRKTRGQCTGSPRQQLDEVARGYTILGTPQDYRNGVGDKRCVSTLIEFCLEIFWHSCHFCCLKVSQDMTSQNCWKDFL